MAILRRTKMKEITIYGAERSIYFFITTETLNATGDKIDSIPVTDEEYEILKEYQSTVGLWYKAQEILKRYNNKIIDKFNKTHGIDI